MTLVILFGCNIGAGVLAVIFNMELWHYAVILMLGNIAGFAGGRVRHTDDL